MAKPSQLRGEPKASSHTKSDDTSSVILRVLKSVQAAGQIASAEAFSKLKGWMRRMADGNRADFRTPLFSIKKAGARRIIHKSREDIVREFDSILSTVNVPDGYLEEVLTEHEAGQRGNIGPQSTHKGWMSDGPDKLQAVMSDKPPSAKLNRPALDRALERTLSFLPHGSIEVISFDEAIRGRDGYGGGHAIDGEGMDVATNSGPPYFTNPWFVTEGMSEEKRLETQRAQDYILRRADEVWSLLLTGKSPEWWAVVSQRLVQKGPDPYGPKKKRIVIALEKSEPIIWKRFTVNLQAALKQITPFPGGVKPFAAWNDLPTIDMQCQKALQEAEQYGRTVLSGDLSSFDATVPPWLIPMVGKVIGYWVRGCEKLVPALCYAMAYNVNVITPNKIWKSQPSSMKSGSGGTNLLDSLINIVVQLYGEEIGLYKIHNLAVQGDDFFNDGPGVSPEAAAEVFSHFGMIAHPDKQLSKRRALAFLQRIHYLGWEGGIASVFRVLGSALSYERLRYKSQDWNAYSDVVRVISQLENAVFSPWFQVLVDFVKSGDRLKLGAELAPAEVIKRSGEAGRDMLERDVAASWKSGVTASGFDRSVVNGALRGETFPPQGGREFFLRAYGERATKVA